VGREVYGGGGCGSGGAPATQVDGMSVAAAGGEAGASVPAASVAAAAPHQPPQGTSWQLRLRRHQLVAP